MLRALTLAIGDLADGRIFAILLRSLVVTLLVFAGIAIALGWALHGVDPCGWWSGNDSCPLDASASGLGALLLTAIALWLLFPAIALGVISAYMDRIVAAVEARHYPAALERARPLGIAGGAWLGLRSSARVILYNLIALPFYIVLLVTGVGTVVLFVLVNGVAIGRDLGEMVAARHGDRASRRAWLRATRAERALMGGIVTAIFLVPFVNLLAPVFGAAMATHLYHGRGMDG
jgi:CysZ protein